MPQDQPVGQPDGTKGEGQAPEGRTPGDCHLNGRGRFRSGLFGLEAMALQQPQSPQHQRNHQQYDRGAETDERPAPAEVFGQDMGGGERDRAGEPADQGDRGNRGARLGASRHSDDREARLVEAD